MVKINNHQFIPGISWYHILHIRHQIPDKASLGCSLDVREMPEPFPGNALLPTSQIHRTGEDAEAAFLPHANHYQLTSRETGHLEDSSHG